MDGGAVAARVERAKELLGTAHNAALATVNPDGTPHNSPLFFAFDDTLEHFYWSSQPAAEHSKNIERTGQGFLVIYEADQSGGLFMQLKNGHSTDDSAALDAFNNRRRALGKTAVTKEHFNGPQTLYCAEVTGLWVNISERNDQGYVVRDSRHQIERADLAGFSGKLKA